MKNPMHPKIEAFWKNAGYKIEVYPKFDNKELSYVYALKKDASSLWSPKLISYTVKEYGLITIYYYLNCRIYFESQMLKLINLKGFL